VSVLRVEIRRLFENNRVTSKVTNRSENNLINVIYDKAIAKQENFSTTKHTTSIDENETDCSESSSIAYSQDKFHENVFFSSLSSSLDDVSSRIMIDEIETDSSRENSSSSNVSSSFIEVAKDIEQKLQEIAESIKKTGRIVAFVDVEISTNYDISVSMILNSRSSLINSNSELSI